MATYLCLYRYTDRGIQHLKDSPKRVEAARKLAKSLGGDIGQFFLLLGGFDTAAIVQAPDDETMAKINLAICSQGNVHSQTLRAFSEEDFRKMIGGLP